MAKLRACPLCGLSIDQNVAAHPCSHGNACRYLCRDDGLPVDWRSPECDTCRVAGRNVARTQRSLRVVPGGRSNIADNDDSA